jgi:NTE family protein
METGYKRTLELMDSIKNRVSREVTPQEIARRRKAYKESLPPLIFRNIHITGVNEAQKAYIEAQLHRDIYGEFTMEEFRRAYFKMLTYSKIKEIVPHAVYNRKEKKFDLYLDVKVKDEILVGFGGNISSHQANQLFLGLGYQNISSFSTDLNANFQMGNSFDGILLNSRFYLQTRIPAYINVEEVFSNKKYSENQSLFYEDIVPSIIKQKELYTSLAFGFPFLNKAKSEIRFSYGQLNDYYFQTSSIPFPNASFDHSWYNTFAGSLKIEHNSLDFKQYPTSGRKQYVRAMYVRASENYKPASIAYPLFDKTIHNWLQAKVHWQHYHVMSPAFNMGFLGELVVSTKNLMNNYTASILQAPAFTPTPHSEIVFNEAFRANQYVAAGVSPIVKLSKMVHIRAGLFCFVPFSEIKKETRTEANKYVDIPYYGKFMSSLKYMGETAFVVQLPFATISIYANGYSYPKKNFNFGLNIGYLIFNPKMLD